MNIAYLILAHRNPAQIRRLFDAIHDPSNTYLFHIDQKSPPDCHAVVEAIAARHPNVYKMASRDVRWASFSVVDATLAGMRQLLELDSRWDYFFNLSGQDFPLQSQAAIRERLAKTPGSNFVEDFDPASRWADPYFRVRRVRIESPIGTRAFNIPKLRIDRWARHLGDAVYRGGSSYYTLNRRFCELLLDSPLLPAYRRMYKYTYAADESFMQTFLYNSPMRDSIVRDNLRLIDWREGLAQPTTLMSSDVALLEASDALFARKFDLALDPAVFDFLEARLRSA